MNATARIGSLALAALVAASASYTWHLHGELQLLAKRVGALSVELARVREASEAAQLLPQAAPALRVQTTTAPPMPVAQIRDVVLGELARREEDERVVAEANLELVTDQLRESLSKQLELDPDTLGRLETLGDELAATERSLLAESEGGRTTEAKARSQYFSAWNDNESKVRQLLGEPRYRKLAELRREHPEFARSFHVLRAPPAAADDQENRR